MSRKVLFLINNLQIGGAEMLLVDVINNWPTPDKLFLVLLGNQEDLFSKILVPIKFHSLVKNSNFARLIELRDYIQKNNIDFIFSHLEKSNKIALVASIGLKVQVIPAIHSVNLYKKKSFKNRFTSALYNVLSYKIIAISDAVEEYLISDLKIFHRKIQKIKNGIDLNRLKFNNQIEELPKTREFFTLGRLVEAKGYDFLIRVLNGKNLRNLDWHLTIIGDGDKREELEDLITTYGLSEKIDITGKSYKPFSLIKPGSFALMPSRREGLPIALIEILSKAIPVGASDIAPLNLIQNNFNGLRFISENDRSFEEMILKIFALNLEGYTNLAKNAEGSVIGYDIKTCVKKYHQLTL